MEYHGNINDERNEMNIKINDQSMKASHKEVSMNYRQKRAKTERNQLEISER
jgi:hypothetical protein